MEKEQKKGWKLVVLQIWAVIAPVLSALVVYHMTSKAPELARSFEQAGSFEGKSRALSVYIGQVENTGDAPAEQVKVGFHAINGKIIELAGTANPLIETTEDTPDDQTRLVTIDSLNPGESISFSVLTERPDADLKMFVRAKGVNVVGSTGGIPARRMFSLLVGLGAAGTVLFAFTLVDLLFAIKELTRTRRRMVGGENAPLGVGSGDAAEG